MDIHGSGQRAVEDPVRVDCLPLFQAYLSACEHLEMENTVAMWTRDGFPQYKLLRKVKWWRCEVTHTARARTPSTARAPASSAGTSTAGARWTETPRCSSTSWCWRTPGASAVRCSPSRPAASRGDTGLTVLVPPQVWLVPSPRALLEGDRHALVATCMVMGSTPLPQVWWDTAVEGEQEMTNTANANGTVTVTSSLYVHPERDMKGKDAVCTVNHSSLAQPLHVPYKLNVYHVPEVMIKRSSENWQADMEGAALQCEENGNPPATGFVWTRMGDPLPSNLTQDGSRLLFTKRLTMEDSGTYVCEVSNEIGSRSAKMKITISDPNVAEMSLLTLAFVAIGVVGLVLVLIFIGAMIAVNRSHRKKTEQMVFKLEEISTMSRQPSIRRCNSMSASVDVRLQEAGGSRDIDQLELEPMMEEMVPPQRSSSRDLLAVSVGGQVQPLPLGTHRYSLRSTTSEPRYSPAYPFGAYRNSLPSNQRHSLREWVLNHSERSGSPGDVPEISSRELTAALEQVSSLSPRPLTPSPSEQGSQTEDEEEVADRQKSIHAAMGHFYPHNGTLRAKPGSSTVYIARREHCV
ncbi:nectin-4-like [Rhinoraja longicauda]